MKKLIFLCVLLIATSAWAGNLSDYLPTSGYQPLDSDLTDIADKTGAGTWAFGTVTGSNITSGANPGHTHTTTSISGVDIGDDTNLAVTYPILLSGDTVKLAWEKEFTIATPENLSDAAGRTTASIPTIKNTTGSTITITEIEAVASTDDYTFLLFESGGEYDFGTPNDNQVESCACSSNGTAAYYFFGTTGFDDATLANDRTLIFEHSSGTADWVKVRIKGTY